MATTLKAVQYGKQGFVRRSWRRIRKYIAVLQVSIASNLAYLAEVFFRALLFVLLGIQAGLIFTAFLVILCSLAFFLGNTEGLAQQMLGALVSFSTYPMNIFSGV